jgi:hypothetical protein
MFSFLSCSEAFKASWSVMPVHPGQRAVLHPSLSSLRSPAEGTGGRFRVGEAHGGVPFQGASELPVSHHLPFRHLACGEPQGIEERACAALENNQAVVVGMLRVMDIITENLPEQKAVIGSVAESDASFCKADNFNPAFGAKNRGIRSSMKRPDGPKRGTGKKRPARFRHAARVDALCMKRKTAEAGEQGIKARTAIPVFFGESLLGPCGSTARD